MARRAPGKSDPRVVKLVLYLTSAQDVLNREEQALASGKRTAVGYERAVSKTLKEVEETFEQWLAGPFGEMFMEGVLVAGTVTPSMKAGVAQILDGLRSTTYADVARATGFMRADSKRVIRQVAEAVAELHLKKGLDIPQSRRLVALRLQKEGFIRETRREFKTTRAPGLRFVDKAGRNWRLDTYAEVVVRTKTAHAYSTGTLRALEARGQTHAKIKDGVNDEVCRAANGSIVSIAWGLSNTVGHPNCTRAFSPVGGI